MDAERLKRIERIFHAAIELEPEARESFIEESCGDDESLRREVSSLLASDGGFDSFIDTSPRSLINSALKVAQPEVKSDSLIGAEINQYRILSLIGEGGMGTVYLADDRKLERKVAVKFLGSEFAGDRGRRERFFREARSASALNHPNILTVHEIGEFHETFYIVTEFVRGETLKQRQKREALTVDETLAIGTQICSALAAAHEAGIVHRDIKPDNVMIRTDGIVKILDFGIAKLDPGTFGADSEAETRVEAATAPGLIIGTPQYMSPEQARGQKVDNRSDIFSLGVVLYEMIAGTPPFRGATNIDTIGSILKDEPPPLADAVPGLIPELERVVLTALRKEREKRFQSVAEMLDELNGVRRSIEISASSAGNTESGRVRATVEETSSIVLKRRFSLVHFLGLVLVIAVIGGGIYWFVLRNRLPVGGAPMKSNEIVSWASSPNEVYSIGAFAPDGRKIAYTSTSGGTQQIWVKQTSSGDPIRVTKDEFTNKNPVWSPSGDEIAYVSQRTADIGIWKIPALGGSPSLVASFDNAGAQIRRWSASNKIYFESNRELFAVDAGGGESKPVTNFRANGIDAKWIGISADEKQASYITQDETTYRLWTAPIAGGTPKVLVESAEDMRGTVWDPDGRRIYFSRKSGDALQVFVADVSGSAPVQVGSGERDSLVVDVSGDGSQILFGSAKEESDVWGVNLKDGKEFTLASNIDSELWPSISSDGKSIAYQSIKNLSQGNRIFNGRIMIARPGTGNPPAELVAEGFLPVWSPDGQQIAFMRVTGTSPRIETIGASGGASRVIAEGGLITLDFGVLPYNRLQATYFVWSPDSRRIAYISDRSGQSNIWTVSADGSEAAQLTANPDPKSSVKSPIWSADGRSIAFSVRHSGPENTGYSISVTDLETKETRELTRRRTFLRLLGWISPDELLAAGIEGSSISTLATEVSIVSINVKSGVTKEIVRLSESYLYNVLPSPDGKMLAFAAHRDGRDNLWTMPLPSGTQRQVTANNDSRLFFSSLAWAPDASAIYFGKQSRFSLLSMLTSSK